LAYLQYQQIASINWDKLQTISEDTLTTLANATQQIPGFDGSGNAAPAGLIMTNLGIPLTGSLAINVMETGILSDVKAKRSKSARQTNMHLSIYATSNDTSNILTPLLSRFIRLNLPEYNLETFTEICYKLLSRKYDKDHETIQVIVGYVWEHTRDVREAIAIAKIVDTSAILIL
jgi:hypothetical protein